MSQHSKWLVSALIVLFVLSLAACGANQASLALASPESPKVGDTFAVPVLLDTATAAVDSVDLVLNFDPKVLTLVKIDKGSIFENYPLSEGGKNGEIKISAASIKTFFTGQGTLATLNFKAKTAGTTAVSFDFEPGSTLDCDVMSQTADILGQVSNLDLTIQAQN